MSRYVFPTPEKFEPKHSNRDLSLYKTFTLSPGVLAPVLTIDMLPADWMRVNTTMKLTTLPMVAPVRGRWKVNFDYYYEPWSNLYGHMDNNSKIDASAYLNMDRWTIPVGVDNEVTYSVSDSTPGIPGFRLNLLPQVGSASLLDFLGCPVGFYGYLDNVQMDEENCYLSGFAIRSRRIPAEGFLTYLDIIRNYYVNPQQDTAVYVGSVLPPDPNSTDVVDTSYVYRSTSQDWLDDLFVALRARKYYSHHYLEQLVYSETGSGTVGNGLIENILGYSQGSDPIVSSPDVRSHTGRLGGLFLRTYRMDLLRGMMNNSVGIYKASVNTYPAIDPETLQQTGTRFDITTMYFANKLQQFINYFDVTNHRFTDIIRTQWNIDPGIQVDMPIYLGSHSSWLDTVDVVATANGSNEDESSQLGQQAGYFAGFLGGKGQRPIAIKSKQYGTLQCIFSIVPDVVYSQGFELNTLKTKFSDIYNPLFANLGFQDVSQAELRAFPSFDFITKTDADGVGTYPVLTGVVDPNPFDNAVGKRIAWCEYMASLNRSHGDFAFGESLDYWVNNRKYVTDEIDSQNVSIGTDATEWPVRYLSNQQAYLRRISPVDLTTYVYPHLWNTPFVNKDVSAMNFLVDVYFEIEANRALGKRIMSHM